MKPHVLWIGDISWKLPCPSPPFPLKPSPPKGQHGVHELRETQMLLARLVSCGNGLVSCHQAGCMPLCQLCPHEGFNLHLFCCYPSWSWSLRELNYLWEGFSLCQVCWELTDRFSVTRGTGNAIASHFHVKSGDKPLRTVRFNCVSTGMVST